MNPNSAHQVWSRWTITIDLPHKASHDAPAFVNRITLEHARLMRRLFGSAGEARINRELKVTKTGMRERWTLEARVEGVPVHDAMYRSRTCQTIQNFYATGFGAQATVECLARLEAGDAQDGKPAAQLLILPTVSIHDDPENIHV